MGVGGSTEEGVSRGASDDFFAAFVVVLSFSTLYSSEVSASYHSVYSVLYRDIASLTCVW